MTTAKLDLDERLLLAARAGTIDTVTALIGEGANASARDADGMSATDHARKAGHTEVALALERAGVAQHPQAELFLAVLDDYYGRTSSAAERADLAARNATGMTALMLAARYRRHSAMDALLSAGAKIDQSVLAFAIEAGDLQGMLTLLDRGGVIDVALMRAACAQSDSDLVKHLLLRGFDVTPYPELHSAETESERLLRNARAGRPAPPMSPTAASRSDCALCRDLPDSMGWCHSANGDRTGAPLPTVTEQFQIFGWSRIGVWKCPHCATYYNYEFDHDNGITDGWDSEYLTRIADTRALELLRGMSAEPRIEREILALTAWIAFDEALLAPGRKAVVTDPDAHDGMRRLYIYGLSSDGAKPLAARRVMEESVGARVSALVARGLEIAETEEYCNIVWVHGPDRLDVFDDERTLLEIAGDRATISGGRVVVRADVARVIAYASDHSVHRGIKVALRSGEEVDFVMEFSAGAYANEMGAPVYSRNELIVETVWCSTLGFAIARWANVEFMDQI